MRRRLGPAVVVLIGTALLQACGNGRSPSILDSQGTEAKKLEDVWWLMFSLAAGVYLVVGGLILFAVLRNRRGEGEVPHSRLNDHAFVVIGGLLVPLTILGVLAFVTVKTTTEVRQPARGELAVDVRAHDWWWEVRYPGTDIVTANEIHIPVGRPVAITIRTNDVIHSFWVPQLAGKLDAIPGQTNVLRFAAERAGVYRGECAEFCGIQHANMNFLVIAESPTRFGQWQQTEALAAGLPTDDTTERGRVVFERESCAGCHTVRGTSASGTFGPDLTHVGSRRTIGAATVPNTTANLAGWIADAQSIKPGNRMPPISLAPDDLLAIVKYLQAQK